MSKGLYIGVSNVARKAKKAYVGVNNVARKVKKIYIGVNGVARLAWQGTVPAGQIVFTSSQVWTVPDGVRIVDVFCVGGGGRGYQAGGGAGGRTATYANVSVTPGQQIGITIGAGATTSGWINLEPMSINTVVAGTTYFGGLSAGGGESALYCFSQVDGTEVQEIMKTMPLASVEMVVQVEAVPDGNPITEQKEETEVPMEATVFLVDFGWDLAI